MNDPVALRRYVREVLCFAKGRKFTERQIFDGVQRLAREPLSVDEFQSLLRGISIDARNDRIWLGLLAKHGEREIEEQMQDQRLQAAEWDAYVRHSFTLPPWASSRRS